MKRPSNSIRMRVSLKGPSLDTIMPHYVDLNMPPLAFNVSNEAFIKAVRKRLENMFAESNYIYVFGDASTDKTVLPDEGLKVHHLLDLNDFDLTSEWHFINSKGEYLGKPEDFE